MNSKVLITLVVVLILVVAGGGFLLLNKSGQEPSPKTTQTEQAEVSEVEEQVEEENQDESIDDEDAEEITVTLTSTGFSPKIIEINAGDKVVWINSLGKMATVDSAPHPIHTSYPEMNLGNFDDGEEMEFVFPKTGTYNYHNHLNASQGGSVTVQ